GQGAKRLQGAGIDVITGVVEDKCIELLNPFLSLVTTGRPWVCLKMAASLDGRIAPGPGQNAWLTGEKARAWTHRLRNRSEAILVGRATVAADDPALTTRLPRTRGQNPLRVVLDSFLALDPAARVVSGPKEGGPAGGGCLVLTTPQAPGERRTRLEAAGAEVKTLPAGPGGVDLEAVLDELGRRGVMRLLVEGGPRVAGRFVRAGLVDEVFFLLAPVIIGGENAPGMLSGPDLLEMSEASHLSEIKTRRLGPDLLVAARLNRPQKGPQEE
ncbi:MAG: bifunctional diaminohydroxyphosphoribosylaminopyrimidine deaminase/5-amino-6-(5-phosphoribosylamino)uracil reductase RibD, partial [Deltaproteobacteria bacterium]|nr:bifunctional diaminohydroxyphosphoribosylaminopyrimidine deaminase/5-amino-6-(5-phosphoribosylamino)uracil reductase RibD [Deltaproteobacteria bacterium]